MDANLLGQRNKGGDRCAGKIAINAHTHTHKHCGGGNITFVFEQGFVAEQVAWHCDGTFAAAVLNGSPDACVEASTNLIAVVGFFDKQG